MSPYAAVSYLRRGMGYDDHLKEYAKTHRTDPEELFTKLDELHESALSVRSIDEWIKYITKKRAEPAPGDKKTGGAAAEGCADAVCISTMHRSKGLEYTAVFIPDANEGLVPYRLALLPEETEEERRLFYVAVTRAKRRLYILHTKLRFNREMKPSRFIGEMDQGATGFIQSKT